VASRRRSAGRGWKSLGIGILILGAIRIPLPQADYHNIRHHDAPGEVCLYHDHLLRWHPQAGSNEDVALLHWHWFLPLVSPGSQDGGADSEHHSPRSGPAIHAHLGDWAEPDWSGAPVIRPEGRGRLLDLQALRLSAFGSASAPNSSIVDDLRTSLFSARSDDVVAGLRAARTSLLQRWNC
jgi:hypothetical protein